MRATSYLLLSVHSLPRILEISDVEFHRMKNTMTILCGLKFSYKISNRQLSFFSLK